jgi:hypothetical protein
LRDRRPVSIASSPPGWQPDQAGTASVRPAVPAADEEHRELAEVPEQVLFATKPHWLMSCWAARTTRSGS